MNRAHSESEEDRILAIDIGGTKLAVGIAGGERFRQSGELERIVKEPVGEAGDPARLLPRITAIAADLLGDRSGDLSAIGISIGGPLDHATGTVINFPHLPGWKNIALTRLLSESLGVPAALDNDANLGALAELCWGAGRGYRDMVYLTISTGIGGGVIINGELLHGIGSAAGEVGHITVLSNGPRCPCGNPGCLEMMASGSAIARRAREALAVTRERSMLHEMAGDDPASLTSHHVLEASRCGDRLAGELWEETADFIAIGLAGIIHVVAPELIVLGGGVAQAGEDLLEPVRRRLRHHGSYVPFDRIGVVAAALGHDSALIGAATLAAGLSAP